MAAHDNLFLILDSKNASNICFLACLHIFSEIDVNYTPRTTWEDPHWNWNIQKDEIRLVSRNCIRHWTAVI